MSCVLLLLRSSLAPVCISSEIVLFVYIHAYICIYIYIYVYKYTAMMSWLLFNDETESEGRTIYRAVSVCPSNNSSAKMVTNVLVFCTYKVVNIIYVLHV